MKSRSSAAFAATALALVGLALAVAISTADRTLWASYLVAVMVGMVVACRPTQRARWLPSVHAEAVRIAITTLTVACAGLATGLAASVGGSVAVATLEFALGTAGMALLRATRTFDAGLDLTTTAVEQTVSVRERVVVS